MKPDGRIIKLVRDRIPEIVSRERGEKAVYRVAGKREYLRLLREKLEEEVAEYLAGEAAEELADIAEVIRALGEAGGMSPRRMESIRREKARERGGFRGRKVMGFKLRKDT